MLAYCFGNPVDEDTPPEEAMLGRGVRQRPSKLQAAIRAAERQSHVQFIWRVFGISLVMVVFTTPQWFCVYLFDSFQKFVIAYDYLGLIWILLTLLLLLALVIRFELNTRSSKRLMVVVCLLAELSSIVVARPIHAAQLFDYLYASLGTIVVILVSFLLALRRQVCEFLFIDVDWTYKSLCKWSLRLFAATSIGNVVSMAARDAHLHAVVSVALGMTLSFFTMIFGRSIGSQAFFKADERKEPLITLLCYLNFESLFANMLLFFQSIRIIRGL